MARLTKSQIEDLSNSGSTEGASIGIHYTGVPNLFVQVRNSGASWIFRYTYRGRNRSMGLGPLHKVGYQTAIDEAARWKAILVDGADPIEVRDAERVPADEAPPIASDVVTLRRACRAYISYAAPAWKDDRTEMRWAQRLRRHVYPALGNRPISTITVDDIAETLGPLWRRAYPTGRRVLGNLRLVFRHAQAMEWFSGPNPADPEASPKLLVALGGPQRHITRHRRALDWPDVPAAWDALAGETTPAAACLRLIILTVARSSMVREAVWEEFDLTKALWVLPPARMKQPRRFRVPLSPAALTVLEAQGPQPSGLVFPGRQGKKLSSIAPNRVLDKLGLDATPHGFRSSFIDWAREEARIDREVRELCLAHVEGSETIRAYARSDLLASRAEVMGAWARFVTGSAR